MMSVTVKFIIVLA